MHANLAQNTTTTTTTAAAAAAAAAVSNAHTHSYLDGGNETLKQRCSVAE